MDRGVHIIYIIWTGGYQIEGVGFIWDTGAPPRLAPGGLAPLPPPPSLRHCFIQKEQIEGSASDAFDELANQLPKFLWHLSRILLGCKTCC